MPATATENHPTREPATLIVGVAALVAAAILLGSIVWATSATSVTTGLAYLAADRWGVVTLIDVYAGAAVVAVWMWVCVRHVGIWLVWVVALLCLGHLISLLFLASRTLTNRTLRAAILPPDPRA